MSLRTYALLLAVAASLAQISLSQEPQLSADRVTVTVPELGTVVGRKSTAGGDVDVFLGVPFAKPPRRFQPAELVETWGEAPLDASAFGPSCMQTGDGREAWHPVRSEDCLTLNVWKPAGADAASPAPVMLWIYGGRTAAPTTRSTAAKDWRVTVLRSFPSTIGWERWASFPSKAELVRAPAR